MPKQNEKNTKEIANTIIDFFDSGGDDNLFKDVAKQLQKAASGEIDNQKINVTSAVRLNEDELKRIRAYFKSVINKVFPINNTTDSGVVGGLKIEWGDFMIDMTLKTRLNNLKNSLK